ncbi:zf-DHHC-domain-containing protein [Punctularia strigosozonata HHB-11173 SS5]|uniref:Palmitoyltransferase n=1 Tax=Punctularia strigosozonata (strain HHB-11173) TaxID=741275 RepID=R7S5D5_PUNST|nr:zf-DHHC-domain-containing protein [Punctularia strigosozonata HHB-11173 SS5]EIN05184.1 zf-DHHC-domain-containing protein [Punctularia strigosozonata HHB-11173 SS5]
MRQSDDLITSTPAVLWDVVSAPASVLRRPMSPSVDYNGGILRPNPNSNDDPAPTAASHSVHNDERPTSTRRPSTRASQGGRGDHRCCGIVAESARAARQRRYARQKKQPWIVLKLAVFITVGIMVYACYVYIGRFCVPMIHRSSGALGSRSEGIAFLVVVCPLAIMMFWSYAMVVFTPPGQARKVVEKSTPPFDLPPEDSWHTYEEEDGTAADEERTRGRSYEQMSRQPTRSSIPHPQPSHTRQLSHSHTQSLTSDHTLMDPSAQHVTPEKRMGSPPPPPSDPNAGVLHAIPAVASQAAQTQTLSPPPPAHTPGSRQVQHQYHYPRSQGPSNSGSYSYRQPPLPGTYSRQPSDRPVLLPEFRYCQRDGLIKPYRAHHCRLCGTCILRYDHHCPWIGQCVGAFNHKFFLVFLLWALLFCLWVFSTLLGMNVRHGDENDSNVDAQHIVIIALSALFSLFTSTLLVSHTRLILLNMTTVEQLMAHSMHEREREGLNMMYACWEFRAKRRTKRQWDEEWGRIGREGNLWWLGSMRANWESVMGPRPLFWFLPVGRPTYDGMNFPTNPRFDAEGRWRPRKEWPPELR